MQSSHMIAVEHGVHDQLPVCLNREGSVMGQIAVPHSQGVKIHCQFAGNRREIIFLGRIEPDPDQATRFARGQFEQA